MIPGKPMAAPVGRIWAACYMDSNTECFEIRTEQAGFPGSVNTLYHKEYPIGTALTNFLYADLRTLPVHFQRVKEHLTAIRAGRDVKRHFMQLFDIAMYWLRQSTLFAPLAASIQRLHLQFEQGKRLKTEEIEQQMAYYEALQPKLLFLAEHLFEMDAPEDMTARYFAQKTKFHEQKSPAWQNYLPLCYGVISFGPVVKGVGGFFPYDNMYEACGKNYHNDFVDFMAQTLDAESPTDFVQFALAEYLRKDVHFRICKYCGRYFGVTGNPKTEFCDRLIDGSTKTCKEIGSFRLYEKRTLENPAVKEYKRSYKAHNARIRYGTMTREEFTAWSLQAREKRDLCVAGKLPLEDFVAWLDSDRQG